MEHLVALAFLNKLSDFEKDDSLREKIKGAIMQGHPGSQICRVWGIKPDTLAEKDTDEMQRLLVIWRMKRDAPHLAHSTLEVCQCTGEKEDIAAWLNFANQEFKWPVALQAPTWPVESTALLPHQDSYHESPQMIPHDPEKFLAGTCECQTCVGHFGIPRNQEKRVVDPQKLRERLTRD
jgi:hypothetical protein